MTPPPGRTEDIPGYSVLQIKAQALGALLEAGDTEDAR
jgi:hypothetical protein